MVRDEDEGVDGMDTGKLASSDGSDFGGNEHQKNARSPIQ
jgi:hypothetical protein